MTLLVIALDGVIVVVVIVSDEVAIIGEDVATLRLVLCDDVGAHVSVLNMHLFLLLLLLLLVLLLQRLPQVFLVKVLMRCLW